MSDSNQDELYTIQEDQPAPEKVDPIAKAFEMIASTQQEQSKILSAVAEKVNNPQPVNVYNQPQPQHIPNDPIQTMQNEINSIAGQLEQQLENGDIDRDQYYQRYERLVSPKKEQLRDMRYRNDLAATKVEMQKSYQEQFDEQKKILDQIQATNQAKSEQEKIRNISSQYPDATRPDTPLFKEMEAILSDSTMSAIFTDPNGNKDQYLALARMADANLKAKGITNNNRSNPGVNQFASLGNPGAYNNTGTPTTFTSDHINQLKNEFGSALTNERLVRLSNYNAQISDSNSVTITDWLVNNG